LYKEEKHQREGKSSMYQSCKKAFLSIVLSSTLFSGMMTPHTYAENIPTASNLQEVESLLVTYFTGRNKDFTIHYTGDAYELAKKVQDIQEEIQEKDPYLGFSLKEWKFRISGTQGNAQVYFTVGYWDTKEQEDYLNERIDQIISQIIQPGMTDDEKVKAIHDYIVLHVAYDQTLTKYSPYNALVEGTAVCQGYSMLTYKMLHRAGIQNYIVEGEADGEPHAWNLVNLDGKWYHLDTTWDDPVPDVAGRVSYEYYNLTDEQMKNRKHVWTKTYPAATSLYYEDLKDKIKNNPTHATAYYKLGVSLGYDYDKVPIDIKSSKVNSQATVNKQSDITNVSSASVIFKLESTSYIVNGKQEHMDTKPFIKYDRMYIPVRFIAQSLGISDKDIQWDETSQRVTIYSKGRIIQAKCGERKIIVNGTVIPTDAPILRSKQETNNRVMLPYRFIAMALGAKVDWKEDTREIIVSIS
jgi:hypothetical protein